MISVLIGGTVIAATAHNYTLSGTDKNHYRYKKRLVTISLVNN